MRPGQYAKEKRNLRKQKGKGITTFPSKRKGQRESILTESPLEADFCYHLEYDPDVLSYEAQPLGFYYLFEGKVCLYTPDFLVNYISEPKYYEIKYKKYSETKTFSKARFDAIKKQAQSLGIPITMITEEFIYQQPKFTNLQVLHQYEYIDQIPTTFINHIYTALSLGEDRISNLIDGEYQGIQLCYVYQMIANGMLKTDIDAPLSINSVVSRVK
ncbi:TnsA endonuclease N-terminal domain-containing protein [Endozoicomonas elysicola]|uniref:TnsA endonuclease N-terminal domain-containing protein n=1 Tax=Endozoicomonas elysicola TaxID=305900 RepID=A0A081KFP2_9GAMM|nr:TnsA endonuclease N-terminal domain-containing protein [Endozoicomonas elysicola]KEI72968.1 hypothetical protein GV64_21595 [Endozoicomonas elysicola]